MKYTLLKKTLVDNFVKKTRNPLTNSRFCGIMRKTFLEVFIMDSNSGFGSSGAPFEYTVAEAKNKALKTKKALFLTAYVLFVLVVFAILSSINPYLIALVPVTLWMVIWLTWRFTQVEYEYSFFSGELTVNRILGNRTRKNLMKVRIQNFSAVFAATELNQSKIEAFAAEKTIFAASEATAENLWVALWEDAESGKRMALYFEPNEKAIKILKYYNASAMAK
jgi:hypothetical protein